MAMNRAFQKRFQQFLKKRNLTPRAAAYAAELVVCPSAVSNWKDGQEPAAESIRLFFAKFKGENVEEWLALLAQEVAA